MLFSFVKICKLTKMYSLFFFQSREEIRSVGNFFLSLDEIMYVGGKIVPKHFWTGGYRESGGVKPWTGMWKWIGDNSVLNYRTLSHKPPSGWQDGKELLNIEAFTKGTEYDSEIRDRNGDDKLPFVCQIRYDIIMKRFGATSDDLR